MKSDYLSAVRCPLPLLQRKGSIIFFFFIVLSMNFLLIYVTTSQ